MRRSGEVSVTQKPTCWGLQFHVPTTFSTTDVVTDDHAATPAASCSAMPVPKSDRQLYTGHPPQHPARHPSGSHSVPSMKSGSTVDPADWYPYRTPPGLPYDASPEHGHEHPAAAPHPFERSESSRLMSQSTATAVNPRSTIAPGLFGLLQVQP